MSELLDSQYTNYTYPELEIDFEQEFEHSEPEAETTSNFPRIEFRIPKVPALSKADHNDLRDVIMYEASAVLQQIIPTIDQEASWKDRALCAYMYEKEIFSGGPEGSVASRVRQSYEIGKQVCAICPVRVECYAEGQAIGDNNTMRGGIAPRSRGRITSIK